MENDEQRPYSVLTRNDIQEEMKKQIDQISEIFLVSKSDATVLLMYLRWDSTPVLERLGENKEKLLTESGLESVVVDSNQDSSDSSCGICFEIVDKFYEFDDDVKSGDGDDDLISTPFCSHKFCKTCWSEYLDKNFYSLEKVQTSISCPDRYCRAAVGLDTIEKLTVRDQEMYESYILRSYLEGNHGLMIKQCPAPDCKYAIEFHGVKGEEEYGLNVVCLCGHIFCWKCRLESHRPVTCYNASDWLSRDLMNLLDTSDTSLSISWIETSTKPCPHCLCPVEVDRLQWDPFLTCACSGRFCWKCLRSEEAHETKPGVFGGCVELDIFRSRAEDEISCLDRWEAAQMSMQEAKSYLQAFEESNVKKPSDLTKQYNRIIREGLMLIVQCRQILKWSCAYDYLHTENEMSKREYLRFLIEYATTLVQSYSETLKEQTERAFSAANDGELICVRHELFSAAFQTVNIGNYFYHFIKTLQDGLVEVKVKSYDNYGGLHWLCDRCTYGNSWFHKECKMCCNGTASPMEKLND